MRYREDINHTPQKVGKAKVMPPQHQAEALDKPVLLPPQRMRNYFKAVSEHKDVTKLTMMLTSSVSSFKDQINRALNAYTGFNFLWETDRDQVTLLCNNPWVRLSLYPLNKPQSVCHHVHKIIVYLSITRWVEHVAWGCEILSSSPGHAWHPLWVWHPSTVPT